MVKDMHMDMCTGMHIDMCTRMRTNMCTGMFVWMVYRHVCWGDVAPRTVWTVLWHRDVTNSAATAAI